MNRFKDIKALFFSVFMALCATVYITSCQDLGDPKAFITISQTSFELTADGLDSDGNQPTFELRTNENWATKTCPDWVKLNYTSGERGVKVMHLIVGPNETGEIRKGCIELSTASDKAALIFVNQARVSGTLSVSKSSFSVNLIGLLSTGDPATFTVSSTYPWTIESSDWITATPSSGESGETEVTLNIDANDTQEARTGRVTVTYGEEKVNISISQDIKCFTISKNNLQIRPGGTKTLSDEDITTDITSLEDWTVTSKPDWISLNVNGGSAGTTTLNITATENNSDARTGNIYITSTHGVEASISVLQAKQVDYDDQQVGTCYFSETFDWLHQMALDYPSKNMDQMSAVDGSGTTNLNIYNGDGASKYAKYFYADQEGQWYVVKEYDDSRDFIFLLDGYIRIGAIYQTLGIKTGVPLKIADGKYANVELQFKACRNGRDKTNLVVEIEGGGTIVDGETATRSKVIELPDQDATKAWVWQNLSVKILQATADTRITIRPSVNDDYNVNASAKYQRRWLIDDVYVLRTAN